MKALLSLLLIAITCNAASAQENWIFMPTLGVNSTPVDYGNVEGSSNKMGVLIGFMASNLIEEHWSLDYGVTINQRYSAYSFTEESSQLKDLINFPNIPILSDLDLTIYENTTASTQIWTIDVPLSASYKFNSGFLLYGGGFFNYLLSANTDTEKEIHIPVFEAIDPNDLPIDQNLVEFLPKNEVIKSGNSTKEGLNEISYGLIFGLGYQSENWTFKLGYHMGLIDIRDDLDAVNMNIKKQRAVTLSLAYNIRNLFETSNQKPIYDLELIE